MGGELLPNGELKGWKEFGDRLNIGNFLLCQDFKILMNGMKYWVDFIEECIQEYAMDVHEIKTVIPHISSAFIGDELKKEMQSRNVGITGLRTSLKSVISGLHLSLLLWMNTWLRVHKKVRKYCCWFRRVRGLAMAQHC